MHGRIIEVTQMPGHAALGPRREPLARRIEDAVATSVEAMRRSRLTRAASMQRRAGGLTTRCAWCGRFAVGNRFVDRDDVPRFVELTPPERITHGICPECVDELRRTGKSR
jgi:hypothetical protein